MIIPSVPDTCAQGATIKVDAACQDGDDGDENLLLFAWLPNTLKFRPVSVFNLQWQCLPDPPMTAQGFPCATSAPNNKRACDNIGNETLQSGGIGSPHRVQSSSRADHIALLKLGLRRVDGDQRNCFTYSQPRR